jgi:outer membrane protein assembly factor BamB/plastocyanin
MSTLPRVTRRGFVQGTAAVSGALALGAGSFHAVGVFAQEPDEATPVPLPDGPPEDATQANGNWPHIYGDYKGYRQAPTSTIDSSNVGTLGPKWRVPLTNDQGPAAVTGTSIVVDDTIYVGDMLSSITAYDRATGEVRWQKNYGFPTNGPCGVCYAYGAIYSGLGESAQVVKLDAKTGDEIWKVKLSNVKTEGIRQAPIVYGGYLYVCTMPKDANGNPGTRGILHAIDVNDGGTVWYFDLVADNLWGNARENMGAGTWYPPTFDDDGNIYFGNADAAPFPGDEQFPAGSSRPGPNLYASTAMSIDTKTASVRWSFTPKPHDLFDLDYQIAPIITTLPVNGVDTKIAVTAGKTGDIVAVNADTGGILWWQKVGKHLNDQLQQLPADEEHTVEVHPGSNSGVLVPMAYADGVLYSTCNIRPSYYIASRSVRGGDDPYEGEIWAIDVATGTPLWTINLPTFPVGSLVVANDLLFSAGLDGLVRAFRRSDGVQVWSYLTKAGINAPLSIAGDELIVAAATRYYASPDVFPDGNVPDAEYELLSFQLGIGGGTVGEGSGTVQPATPTAAGSVSTSVVTEGAATPEADASGSLSIDLQTIDIAYSLTAIMIPANTDVTVEITNLGALQHDFKIDNPNVYSGMIAPGQTASVVLNFPAGSYQYYCTVEGHADAGMVGTVIAQ